MPVSPTPRTAATKTPAGWTTGPAAWAAIVVLGGACIAGTAWSMGRQAAPWRTPTPAPIVAVRGLPPADPPTASEAGAGVPGALPQAAAQPAATIARRINLNTATQAELELLPGVGPALAKRIIDHRTQRGPFKRVEDLDAVKGIGPKKLDQLRPQVSVD